MGCIQSLNTIQREFEQTKQNLHKIQQDLDKANVTIQNLEAKFSKSNMELTEAKSKLNEIQSYSIFNLPSIPSIPPMFSNNPEMISDENVEEKNKEQTESYFTSMTNMPSFFTSTPSKSEEPSSLPALSAPSFINDFLKSLNDKDNQDNGKLQLDERSSNEINKRDVA